MAALLPAERGTWKGRLFLGAVYALLTLGGITMVLPFMVMIASSFSSNYDYARHAPVLRALWNRNDRFMRSIATCFARFPHDVFPEAPESWTTWQSVAQDRAGVDRFADAILDPLTNRALLVEWRQAAERYREAKVLRRSIVFFPEEEGCGVVAKYECVENIARRAPLPVRSREQ